jgi:tetratricopeptide (TPR) repeat protein
MIARVAAILVLCAFVGVTGCASKDSSKRELARSAKSSAPATQPSGPEMLTLEQIEPKPTLPTSRPTTSSSDEAPLDALAMYADARAKLLANQRFAAITVLEQAIKLDPDSFELRYALGEAYTTTAAGTDQAIAAFAEAAEIRPDDLDVQTQLGRHYLTKGQYDLAMQHLRLARETTEYKSADDESATLTDYLLARVLQQKGYYRAAVDQYEEVLRRLPRTIGTVRGNPELMFLTTRPELVMVQAAELHEKLGNHAAALRIYLLAGERRPDNFELQARAVRVLIAAGRQRDAARRAADILRNFRASPESLKLLRDVFKDNGGDEAIIAELRRLNRADPNDRGILYALVDVLTAADRNAEADKLLTDAVERSGYELDYVRRLFDRYDDRDDVEAAARVLVDALARQPDSLRELSSLWAQLLRPSRSNRLRLPRLQKLDVTPSSEAAKLFWVSRVAQVTNRDILARNTLQEAVKIQPPFAPAYRVLLGQYWMRADWDEQRKTEASNDLIADVERAGDKALAEELHGLLLLHRGKPKEAAESLEKSQRLGNRSPDTQIAQTNALRAAGDTVRSEQLLWKLVGEHPTFEDAYNALFRQYLDAGAVRQADRVVETWLKADPGSDSAKLLEATLLFLRGQAPLAEARMLALFERNAEDAELLISLRELFTRTGRLEEYVKKLEAERAAHPRNQAVVEQLVEIYTAQKRAADASRVLDAARAAAGHDPDLLYYVAHLYTRIGQESTTEQILAEVVEIDPAHAPASNDLGYNWADKGRNLDRAEALIRVAVEAEPDNQSFLDSLGWVLYKRGKFDESLRHLEAAIEPASFPDPVVLDHLGDTLYRLGRKDDAVKQWRRSSERLAQTDSDRHDIRQLRLVLQQKLKQVDAGQPVNVAPVVESAGAAPQQVKGQGSLHK